MNRVPLPTTQGARGRRSRSRSLARAGQRSPAGGGQPLATSAAPFQGQIIGARCPVGEAVRIAAMMSAACAAARQAAPQPPAQ